MGMSENVWYVCPLNAYTNSLVGVYKSIPYLCMCLGECVSVFDGQRGREDNHYFVFSKERERELEFKDKRMTKEREKDV